MIEFPRRWHRKPRTAGIAISVARKEIGDKYEQVHRRMALRALGKFAADRGKGNRSMVEWISKIRIHRVGPLDIIDRTVGVSYQVDYIMVPRKYYTGTPLEFEDV